MPSLTRQEIAARYQFAGLDIPTQLRIWATQSPAKTCMIWHPFSGVPQRWSYAGFWQSVQELAAGLHRRGIRHGDKVVLHCDNCPEIIHAWYACATLGAVAVTTNTAATPSELAFYVEQAQAVAAITQPCYAHLFKPHSAPFVRLQWVLVTGDNSGEPPLAAQSEHGFESFSSLRVADAGVSEFLPLRDPDPLLPAGIVFTSGTTSRPKAVLHSHANYLWAGLMGPANIGFGPDDVACAQLPCFHTNSLLWWIAMALGVGGTFVVVPKLSVSRFWDIVLAHGVTHLSSIKLLTTYLLAHADAVPAGHKLRVLLTGQVTPDIERRLGVRCLGAWGMSETVTHAIRSDLVRPWPAQTIGRPAPGYEIQLVDADSGEPCAPDQPGELWIRGTRGVQMFLEYFNSPEGNRAAFTDDGWFKTGDVLRVGREGNLYFLDRHKDVIKVGGENVSAAEVEATIRQVNGVDDVAVVGRSDAALESVPVAFVIATRDGASPDDLQARVLAHCREQLSRFKVPRAVYLVEEFPRALLDKVAKNKLRELAETLPIAGR